LTFQNIIAKIINGNFVNQHWNVSRGTGKVKECLLPYKSPFHCPKWKKNLYLLKNSANYQRVPSQPGITPRNNSEINISKDDSFK
jgi:hypothetical protein